MAFDIVFGSGHGCGFTKKIQCIITFSFSPSLFPERFRINVLNQLFHKTDRPFRQGVRHGRLHSQVMYCTEKSMYLTLYITSRNFEISHYLTSRNNSYYHTCKNILF